MSADSWTVCPRCKARHEEQQRSLTEAAKSSYGTLDGWNGEFTPKNLPAHAVAGK